MKRVTAIIFILVLISGCSFSKVYTDAIEQTEEHLKTEEFNEALKSIQIALNEKEEDDVALNIESGLLKYRELKKQEEKRDWESVSNVIDSFGTLDSVHPKLKKQVDEINKLMLEQVNLETQLSDDLAKIKSDLDNDLFEDADLLLINLETNKEFDFAQEKILSTRKNYEKQLEVFKKVERELERKKEMEALLLRHKKKLTEAEKKEAKLKQREQSEKSLQALNETEAAYDGVLNEVYQSIIKESPEKEDSLRDIQRQWLLEYEKELYEVRYNSDDYKAIEFSIKTKKERIKELLNEYY